MRKERKIILEEIAKLDEKEQVLFNKKAKLEEEILKIDLEIWHNGQEYQRILKEIIS